MKVFGSAIDITKFLYLSKAKECLKILMKKFSKVSVTKVEWAPAPINYLLLITSADFIFQ